MKTGTTLLTGVLLLTAAGEAAAQSPSGGPVTRADGYAAVAWLNVNKPEIDNYDDWLNRLAYAGGGLGWYWTDHLKTELDAGLSSTTERDLYSFAIVDGRQISTESNYRFSTRGLAISQQYQFFRNVWFHPHVAAGVDLAWERTRREDTVVHISDPVTRQSEHRFQTTVHPARTEFIARPFAAIGFKAYMSPRAFFRMDTRLILKNGVDEALVRFGFGMDF